MKYEYKNRLLRNNLQLCKSIKLSKQRWTDVVLFIYCAFVLDIDECTANTDTCDDTLATCTNIPGSFTCACIAGYTGDGTTCSGM